MIFTGTRFYGHTTNVDMRSWGTVWYHECSAPLIDQHPLITAHSQFAMGPSRLVTFQLPDKTCMPIYRWKSPYQHRRYAQCKDLMTCLAQTEYILCT